MNIPLNTLIFGFLGCVVLLLLQWSISRLFPKPPFQVYENLRRVKQATADGDYQSDADIYRLDQLLTEAEFDHPGSTLLFYYTQPGAVFSRFLGSLLVSFLSVGWVLGTLQATLSSFLVFVFGIGLITFGYMTWYVSRPKIKGK